MISVLIVNYFCHSLTVRAVLSVLADDPSSQVIVVDNSDDLSEAGSLRQGLPPSVELVVAPINLGFGRACNLALDHAAGEYLLLLNPDAFIVSGCLRQLLNTMQADLSIGAVSPVAQWDEAGDFLLPPGQMQTPAWEWMLAIGQRFPVFGNWLSKRFRAYAWSCLSATSPVRQRMLSGGHMLLHRRAIEDAGGLFDRHFFMYYEDTDLCRRLARAGFKLVLDPAARVVHEWRHDPAKTEYSVASRRRYMRKNFTGFMLLDSWRQTFERHFPQKMPLFQDLGICTTAPCFDLPEHQTGHWLLELSPSPLLIPAAFHRATVAPVRIPATVWGLLGPARYWARVTHPDGRESGYVWQIPQSALNPELMKPQQVAADTKSLRLDLAHPVDESELLNLFRTAFGHEMSPEFWRWKYHGQDVLGSLVRRAGRPVAFYGGMPRDIRLFGSPSTAVQIGDVMVHPEERAALSRKGLFFQMATHFLEHFVGAGKTFPVAFGFPSERAFRLASHLGLYERVGELMQVAWPSLKKRPSVKVRVRPLDPEKDAAAVECLWCEMADALHDQVIGVRDWAYLQRRYLQHPAFIYQLHLVSSRWTGAPVAIFVTRIHEGAVELLDIIAPPKRMAVLVHCLRRVAGRLGKSQVYAWITSQHARLLAGDAGAISPTGIMIPHNSWTPGIPARDLIDRWWLMGGDTDFH